MSIATLPNKIFLFQHSSLSTTNDAAVTTLTDDSGLGNHALSINNSTVKLSQTPTGLRVLRANNAAIPLPVSLFSGVQGAEFWAVVGNAVPGSYAWRFGSSGQISHFPYDGGSNYSDFGSSYRMQYAPPRSITTGFHVIRLSMSPEGWRREWTDGYKGIERSDPIAWNTTAPMLGEAIKMDFAFAMLVTGEISDATARDIYTELNTVYGTTAATGTASQDSPDVWIKADALPVVSDGTEVLSIPSAEGNGHLFTAVTGSAPLYKTAVANGLPVLRFDGVDDVITSTTPTHTGAFTMYSVIRPNTLGSALTIIGGSANGSLQVRLEAGKPAMMNQNGTLVGRSSNRGGAALPTDKMSLLTVKWVPTGGYIDTEVDTNEVQPKITSAINLICSNNGVVEQQTAAANHAHWFRVKPAAPTVAVNYRVGSRALWTNRSPKDWKLQGSNSHDGGWVDLDSQTGITFTNGESKLFTISNTTAYTYYRLRISAIASGNILNYVGFAINEIPVMAAGILVFRLNGQPHSSMICSDPVPFGGAGNIVFGRGNGVGESFAGDMGENQVFHRGTTNDFDVATETALMTKWGITPGTGGVDLPAAVLTATTEYSTAWRAAFLHDGVVGGANNSWSAVAATGQALTVDVIAPRALTRYRFVARTDAAPSMPSAWTVEGSANGSTGWTTIDTQSGVTWTAGQDQPFTVANTTPYRYYRWTFTATQGGGVTLPSISEMYLEGLPAAVGGGAGGTQTFTVGMKLFGIVYAPGAALPTMSASVKRSLLRRGLITPTTALKVKRAMKANNTSYAAGDNWPAGSSPAIVRRLLRGRKIG